MAPIVCKPEDFAGTDLRKLDAAILERQAGSTVHRPTDDELRWRILELIRTHEGLRISEVAERLQLDLAHAADLIRELRARGYLGPA